MTVVPNVADIPRNPPTFLTGKGNRLLSREALFALAWGVEMRAGDRSVDVYVRKLRVKLAEALPDWRFIHTHIGFGYRFAPARAATPKHDHEESL